MANYSTLKSAIQAVIKQNGNNEITGGLLQQALLSMVDSLGAGYQFVGIATPLTEPGLPDQRVFYIGASGTYNNFGETQIVVPKGSVAMFTYANGWSGSLLKVTDSLVVVADAETGNVQLVIDDQAKIVVDRQPNLSSPNSNAVASVRYAIDLGVSQNLQEIAFTGGGWIKNNGTTINPGSVNPGVSYSYAVVPCVPGDVFIIDGHGSTNARLWAFADANNNNLLMSDAELTLNNVAVIAPENAAYIVINIENIGNKISYKGKRFIDLMPCRVISNAQFKFALLDENNKVVVGVDYNGDIYNYTKVIQTGCDVNLLSTRSNYSFIFTDAKGRCILAFDSNGNIVLNTVPYIIKQYVQDSIRDLSMDVIHNNLDKEPAIYGAAYKTPFYHYSRLPNGPVNYCALYKKKFVVAWGSDFHGDETAFVRFIQFVNHYSDIIDIGITTGDMVTVTPLDDGFKKTFAKYAPGARVPVLMTIGNHEITGNNESEALLDSIQDSDNLFIAPYSFMYTNKGPGAYYYKDITNQYAGYKFRIIVLNDYESPRLVAGGKWETIDFDGTLSSYDNGRTYSAGEKCNYDGHSYKAAETTVGVTPNRTYIYNITGRYISQAQADWFVNALNTAPAGYKIIVCTHMALDNIVDANNKFTSSQAHNATHYSQNGLMLTDIISAFINKTTLQKTYSLQEPSTSVPGTVIPGYDVVVNADFSEAVAEFVGSLSGHTHTDFTGKSNALGTPEFTITESGHLYNMDDLVKFGVKSIDCFNIISFDETGIDIIRIGCDITTAMEKRDFMRFNI